MPTFWLLALLFLTPPAGQGPVPSPDEASEALPDDELLERQGALVGEILIRTDDVFDLENPKEDRKLFRLERDRFSAAEGFEAPAAPPDDRVLVYPWIVFCIEARADPEGRRFPWETASRRSCSEGRTRHG